MPVCKINFEAEWSYIKQKKWEQSNGRGLNWSKELGEAFCIVVDETWQKVLIPTYIPHLITN